MRTSFSSRHAIQPRYRLTLLAPCIHPHNCYPRNFVAWQLLRRATLLNVDFQARVFDVIASHAVPSVPPACPPSPPPLRCRDGPEPACLVEETTPAHTNDSRFAVTTDCKTPKDSAGCGISQENEDEGFQRTPSVPSLSKMMPRLYAAQNVVTSTVMRAGSGSGDLPSLGRAESLWPHHISTRLGRTFAQSETSSFSSRRPSASNVSSSGPGVLSVPEVRCRFLSRDGPVWVIPAPEKAIGRMREKVAEYRAEGAPWPRAGSILDPVRATVVCEGPAEMLEIADWFLSGACGGKPSSKFPVCRIKNKFAFGGEELVSERVHNIRLISPF